jgi:hypothetical protein
LGCCFHALKAWEYVEQGVGVLITPLVLVAVAAFQSLWDNGKHLGCQFMHLSLSIWWCSYAVTAQDLWRFQHGQKSSNASTHLFCTFGLVCAYSLQFTKLVLFYIFWQHKKAV